MKVTLFYELMQFASSKKTLGEKVRYFFLSLIFYYSLAQLASKSEKGNESSTGSLSGDDIYPLF
jgi:hypothetical protein